MKEKFEAFKASLTENIVINKKEYLLTIAVCILGGILLGVFATPKKDVTICSNNGNNNGNDNVNGKGEFLKDKDEDEDDDED